VSDRVRVLLSKSAMSAVWCGVMWCDVIGSDRVGIWHIA
jgi:hypothetical protein